MKKIPRPAWLWGGVLLLPLVIGTLVSLVPGEKFNAALLVPFDQVSGVFLLVSYGKVFAALNIGALWGMAAKSRQREWRRYGLMGLPMIWLVFTVTGSLEQQLAALIITLALVLLVDLQFRFWKLVPVWWLSFRLLFLLAAGLCLSIGFWA